MRRRTWAFIAVIILFGAAILGAQEDLIPRRIRIVAPEDGNSELLSAILYSSLTRQVPLVVSGPEDVPHNTIVMERGESLVLTLEDRDGVVDRREFPPGFPVDPSDAAAAFDELAVDWAVHLDLVAPDVAQDLEVLREELTGEISFEERLITPFQATLWLPVAARQLVLTDGNDGSSRWIWQWPLRGDFAWYFTENLGATASFRFEYGTHISFGVNNNQDPLETRNLILLPGLGLQLRTLGRLSAEFGISLFMGTVRIVAEEPLFVPSLNTGDVLWVFYPVLSFEPSIVWSPYERWSVKFRVAEFHLGLGGMGGSESSAYGTSENTIIMNFLQLGLAYRW